MGKARDLVAVDGQRGVPAEASGSPARFSGLADHGLAVQQWGHSCATAPFAYATNRWG
jgi:hypothetical protein